MHSFIGTYSGKEFNFLAPRIEEVCIEDIAKSLSMSCRYNGHVHTFYSVAEHCCIMADIIYEATGCAYQALCALLHDASEAYIVDIPRPLKPHLANYAELEALAESVVQRTFGIEPMNELIKYYDTHIVRPEAEQLFKNIPSWVECYEPLDIEVYKWTPAWAEAEFLTRFERFNSAVLGVKNVG